MAMQLATVEQVKGYLAIGSVVDDALLGRMLDAASGYIQTWINRTLERQSYSAQLDGNGSDIVGEGTKRVQRLRQFLQHHAQEWVQRHCKMEPDAGHPCLIPANTFTKVPPSLSSKIKALHWIYSA